MHSRTGPIALLLPSRTTTADANVTSKFLTLSDYLSCTLLMLRLLWLSLVVGQKVNVFTSKIASADLVAPLVIDNLSTGEHGCQVQQCVMHFWDCMADL